MVNQDCRMEIRLPEETRNRCIQRAKELGKNQSEYIRYLIEKDTREQGEVLYPKAVVDALQKLSKDTHNLCSRVQYMDKDTKEHLLPHIKRIEGDMNILWQSLR